MTTDEVYQDYGYVDAGGMQRGSLTEDTFEVDGVTYTVKLIESSGWFYIGFDKQLPVAFTLEVDGTRLDSGDASLNSYGGLKVFWWSDLGMYWRYGQRVTLAMHLN